MIDILANRVQRQPSFPYEVIAELCKQPLCRRVNAWRQYRRYDRLAAQVAQQRPKPLPADRVRIAAASARLNELLHHLGRRLPWTQASADQPQAQLRHPLQLRRNRGLDKTKTVRFGPEPADKLRQWACHHNPVRIRNPTSSRCHDLLLSGWMGSTNQTRRPADYATQTRPWQDSPMPTPRPGNAGYQGEHCDRM